LHQSLSLLSIGLTLFLIPTTTSAATLQAPPNNLGLVGYWPLEDDRGSTAGDVSGFGNDGTLTNMDPATDWLDGRLGTALDFDGNNDFVGIPPFSSFASSGYSTAFWIKTRDLSSQRIAYWDQENNQYQFRVQSDGNFYFYQNDGTDWKSVNAPIDANQWHFVAGTWDGAKMRLYIDGELKGSKSISDLGSPSIGTAIGQAGAKDERYWNGQIDDVRIYDRALTKANVQDLYQSGFTKVNTSRKLSNIGGLTGWWTMDGKDVDWSSSSGQIKDNSGDGNDGTTNGGMTNDQSAAEGRVGQALSFDGSDDYIDVGGADFYDLTAPFSVSGWVNIHKDLSENDVFGKYNDGNGWIFRKYNNVLQLWFDGNGHASKAYNPPTNEWEHWGATWDGSQVKYYVNGALFDSVSTTDTVKSSGNTLKLGQRGDRSNDNDFDGTIDDARIYNQTLTANEIQRIYNATRPSPINTSRTDRLTDGLVGFWSMNGQDVDLSDSAAEVKDTTSNGNDGDAKNGASPAIGKLGQGFGFDGEDDYIAVADSNSLDIKDAITVSAWVKYSSLNKWDRILGKRGSTRSYSLGRDNNTNEYSFALKLESGDRKGITSNTKITTNQWRHIVGVWNGSTMKLYVDGTKESVRSFAGTLISNASNLNIGRNGDDGGYELDGDIDNVRIYDRALSGDEVEKLYRLGE